MNRSNTFDFNRFWLIVRRHWHEFRKISLISLAILLGTLILFYWLNSPPELASRAEQYDTNMSFRIPLFYATAFLFISVISSVYFSALGIKPRAIIELMVPGSQLEKFVSGVFFTCILGAFSYLAIFYLTDLGMVAYLRAGVSYELQVPGFFDHVAQMENFSRFIWTFVSLPFLVSSLFLLGSIYFNRHHYVKTAVVALFGFFFIAWALSRTSNMLTRGKYKVVTGNPIMSTEDQFAWTTICIILLTLAFWIIGYVRLREKEV